jgi:hypothetical protein
LALRNRAAWMFTERWRQMAFTYRLVSAGLLHARCPREPSVACKLLHSDRRCSHLFQSLWLLFI